MNVKQLVVLSALFLGALGTASFAEEGAMKDSMTKGSSPAMEADSAAAPVEVGNKICPISGEKIVPEKMHQVTYKGKVYNLCCSMCDKDFMKDPEAAIKKIEEMDSAKADVKDMDSDDAAEGMQMDGAADSASETNSETK